MLGKLIDRWIAARTRKIEAENRAKEIAEYQHRKDTFRKVFADNSTLTKILKDAPVLTEEQKAADEARKKERVSVWNQTVGLPQGMQPPTAKRRSPFITRTSEGVTYKMADFVLAKERMQEPFIDRYVDETKKALQALSDHFKERKDVGGQAIIKSWMKQVKEWEATYRPHFGDTETSSESILVGD